MLTTEASVERCLFFSTLITFYRWDQKGGLRSLDEHGAMAVLPGALGEQDFRGDKTGSPRLDVAIHPSGD